MIDSSLVAQALTVIKQKAGAIAPKVGIILGSGLNELADTMTDAINISYNNLPGYAKTTVSGHRGVLSLGTYKNIPIACMQGRTHYYEGQGSSALRVSIRTLKALGCELLILTNAAGSMREDIAPGNLVAITDHINFQGHNPLVGDNDEHFGSRFPSMVDAYDPSLRNGLKKVAAQLHIPLYEGVYIGVLGPNYETPAEIRAFRSWGADVVGMSAIPEVILARHCGLKVAAISAVTNFAAGMPGSLLDHADTLNVARQIVGNLTQLIYRFIEDIYENPTHANSSPAGHYIAE